MAVGLGVSRDEQDGVAEALRSVFTDCDFSVRAFVTVVASRRAGAGPYKQSVVIGRRRRFNELANETAGDHFTSREVIRLMVSILFIQDDDEIPARLCDYADVYNDELITLALDFMQATASEAGIAKFGVAVDDVIIIKDSESWDDIGVPLEIPSYFALELMSLVSQQLFE